MTKESEGEELQELYDIGLVDHEFIVIGRIVAHWGAIEGEIFEQTLMTFDKEGLSKNELPKAMNNMQFTDVLSLWKERVVDALSEGRKAILTEQHEKIVKLSKFRNALVHGMLSWDGGDIKTLVSTRVKKRELIVTSFRPEDLVHLFATLAEINLRLRHPEGIWAAIGEQMEKNGGVYYNPAAGRRLKLERRN